MARPVDRHGMRPAMPPPMAPHQLGNLDRITDSERNALRPIGSSALETAQRTSELLASLLALPGVLIFQGVQPSEADIPRIPHVVSAGRRVVLVESVTWPPGSYHATQDGRIHCDDVYIGQSVGPLIAAVLYWRETLPRDHGVSAVVVVHSTGGELMLPPGKMREVTWTGAQEAVQVILLQVFGGRRAASARTLQVLAEASGGRQRRVGSR
jgi:hypothetical protein